MVQQNTEVIYTCQSSGIYYTCVGQNRIICRGLHNWCSECYRYTYNNVRLSFNDNSELFYLWICSECLVS